MTFDLGGHCEVIFLQKCKQILLDSQNDLYWPRGHSGIPLKLLQVSCFFSCFCIIYLWDKMFCAEKNFPHITVLKLYNRSKRCSRWASAGIWSWSTSTETSWSARSKDTSWTRTASRSGSPDTRPSSGRWRSCTKRSRPRPRNTTKSPAGWCTTKAVCWRSEGWSVEWSTAAKWCCGGWGTLTLSGMNGSWKGWTWCSRRSRSSKRRLTERSICCDWQICGATSWSNSGGGWVVNFAWYLVP